MFIIDTTGSMNPWIYAVKSQIKDILKSIYAEHPLATINVSFVCYRDFKK